MKPTTKLNKCANDRQTGDKSRMRMPTSVPGKGKTHFVAEGLPPKKARVVRGGSSNSKHSY